MGIVFVKPQFHYDSYTDFWRLVSLSGFEWCYQNEVNIYSNNIYIHCPANDVTPKLNWWQRKRKTARFIIWDLERPKPRGGIKNHRKYLQHFNYDEVWHSDAQLAKDSETKFVILGSDKQLGNKPAFFKRYKYAHMSYENGRRETILQDVKGKIAPNCWGRKRDKILRQTQIGLNIHQDNDLYGEPLRFALFAAYGLPIVSEKLYDHFPLNNLIYQLDYRNFVTQLDKLKVNSKRGLEIHDLLCNKYQFKNVVQYAIKSY